MSNHSALTPEEWRARSIIAKLGTGAARFEDVGDGDILNAHGGKSPAVYVRGDGSIGVDNSGGEYGCGELDATKVMALANLSLTLQGRPEAIAMPDVAVCQSAAWYFRKLARELIAAAKLKMDPEERASFLDHARSLTDGNEALFRLSETLKALVPPE